MRKTIEKYSLFGNAWYNAADMYDDRNRFCAFIGKIFVIGDLDCNWSTTESCLQFNTGHCIWKEFAGMNEVINIAALKFIEETL